MQFDKFAISYIFPTLFQFLSTIILIHLLRISHFNFNSTQLKLKRILFFFFHLTFLLDLWKLHCPLVALFLYGFFFVQFISRILSFSQFTSFFFYLFLRHFTLNILLFKEKYLKCIKWKRIFTLILLYCYIRENKKVFQFLFYLGSLGLNIFWIENWILWIFIAIVLVFIVFLANLILFLFLRLTNPNRFF